MLLLLALPMLLLLLLLLLELMAWPELLAWPMHGQPRRHNNAGSSGGNVQQVNFIRLQYGAFLAVCKQQQNEGCEGR